TYRRCRTVSVGSFFSIGCRQTGHFFCHILIPPSLRTGPSSPKNCTNRGFGCLYQWAQVQICSQLHSSHTLDALVCSSTMEKPKTFVLLSALAAGSLLF